MGYFYKFTFMGGGEEFFQQELPTVTLNVERDAKTHTI